MKKKQQAERLIQHNEKMKRIDRMNDLLQKLIKYRHL